MASIRADPQGPDARPALVGLRRPHFVHVASGHLGGVLVVQEAAHVVVHINHLVQVLRGQRSGECGEGAGWGSREVLAGSRTWLKMFRLPWPSVLHSRMVLSEEQVRKEPGAGHTRPLPLQAPPLSGYT